MPGPASVGSKPRNLAVAALSVGLVASFVGWLAGAALMDREQRTLFDNEVSTARRMLGDELKRHVDMLRATRAFFDSRGEVSRTEFNRFVERLDLPGNYPGIHGIEFARLVHHDELAAFTARVRADRSLDPAGYPDFSVAPAGTRDRYVIVEYSEPGQAAGVVLGADQAFEPRHREGLERARDTGEGNASAPVQLQQGGPPVSAILIRMALYQPGMPLTSAGERRAAFRGQLTAIVRIRDVVRAVVPQPLLDAYRLRIEDAGPSSGESAASGAAATRPLLVFDSALHASQRQPPDATGDWRPRNMLERTEQIDVAGRAWRLHVSTGAPAGLTAVLPLAILFGGCAASVLLYALIVALTNQRRTAIRLARSSVTRLQANHARYRTLVESIQDVVFETDARGHWTFLNPAWQTLTGYAIDSSVGSDWIVFVHPEDRIAARREFDRLLSQARDAGRVSLRLLTASGGERHVEVHARQLVGDGGDPVGICGTLIDVTQRTGAGQRLAILAHQDPLTGVANRTHLFERATQALEEARRQGGGAGLLFIDLDNFGVINDTLGRAGGDEVLRAVAERLESSVRSIDTVARLGSDEFVVLLAGVHSEEGLARAAVSVQRSLEAPCYAHGRAIVITASIGTALFPEDGEVLPELLRAADAAMVAAKHAGGNRMIAFNGPGRSENPAARATARQ